MLAQYGLNYTRIYPGAIVEPEGFWQVEDMMTPAGKDLIVPWMRSNVPGYKGGGNKFDLSKWDTAYFDRLRDFLKEADKRNIIVEMAFYNCQNKSYWPFLLCKRIIISKESVTATISPFKLWTTNRSSGNNSALLKN